jgi:hypothetical protein
MGQREREICFCKKIEAPVRMSLPHKRGLGLGASCSHLQKRRGTSFPGTLRVPERQHTRGWSSSPGFRCTWSAAFFLLRQVTGVHDRWSRMGRRVVGSRYQLLD